MACHQCIFMIESNVNRIIVIALTFLMLLVGR